jgi:hypothetical protein
MSHANDPATPHGIDTEGMLFFDEFLFIGFHFGFGDRLLNRFYQSTPRQAQR